MRLHEDKEAFKILIIKAAEEYHIPESAIERDYYIVRALSFLSQSEFSDCCVFKGGTSLSKCYPGSIERFSEDIDLTFLPKEDMSDGEIERCLKKIENIMTRGAEIEKINLQRNKRNKSLYFWFGDKDSRIKLEIGSSVRSEPYGLKSLKTYIQDYLEKHGFEDVIKEYCLAKIDINVLAMERTFLDKIMAVKRHAICGSLPEKARHIYDVCRLFQMPDIQGFLINKRELKQLIGLTKETDKVYLEKRNIPKEYNPLGPYSFDKWEKCFMDAKDVYEHLHEELLYTDEKQNFAEAIQTFETIDRILREIGE